MRTLAAISLLLAALICGCVPGGEARAQTFGKDSAPAMAALLKLAEAEPFRNQVAIQLIEAGYQETAVDLLLGSEPDPEILLFISRFLILDEDQRRRLVLWAAEAPPGVERHTDAFLIRELVEAGELDRAVLRVRGLQLDPVQVTPGSDYRLGSRTEEPGHALVSLAVALSKAERKPEATEMLGLAERIALSIAPIRPARGSAVLPVRPHAVASVSWAWIQIGEPERALALLRREMAALDGLAGRHYALSLYAAAVANQDRALAEELLHELDQIQNPPGDVVGGIVRVRYRLGDLDGAIAQVIAFDRYQLTDRPIGDLGGEMIAQEDRAGFTKLVRAALASSAPAHRVTNLGRTARHAGWTDLEQIVIEAFVTGQASPQDEPLSAANWVQTLHYDGRTPEARRLIERLVEEGHIGLPEVMRVLPDVGLGHLALAHLREHDGETSRWLEIVNRMVRAGEHALADETLGELLTRKPHLRPESEVIHALFRVGRMEEALRLARSSDSSFRADPLTLMFAVRERPNPEALLLVIEAATTPKLTFLEARALIGAGVAALKLPVAEQRIVAERLLALRN